MNGKDGNFHYQNHSPALMSEGIFPSDIGLTSSALWDQSFGTNNGKVENNRDHNVRRKMGRRGDPRMHRAVAARLKNPQLSLLEALLQGGFRFPNLSEGNNSGGLNGQISDTDNIQLCQRKNQLSRRLRLAKKANTQESISFVNSLSEAGFL